MISETQAVYFREDTLAGLADSAPLNRKIALVHQSIKVQAPFVERVAVALFDFGSKLLKTFLASHPGENPLVQYEATLDNAPSLKEIATSRKARVVNDLSIFEQGAHSHTRLLGGAGFQSSYAFPMQARNRMMGFIFFKSFQKRVFTEERLQLLDIYAHLLTQLVLAEVSAIQTLLAAFRTVNRLKRYKDPETGNHLERMSRFARLIAQELARSGKLRLDDEYIEYVFVFAPLHDIGKLGIPDRILLKPARLSPEEWQVMKTHASKGREIIDTVVSNFGLEACHHLDVLRHIAEQHHETLDGKGYPLGLAAVEVTLAARIVAVADIFDALTSVRPYKPAWPNAEAIAWLRKEAVDRLDLDCVEALCARLSEVEAIQKDFRDEENNWGAEFYS